ncbi:succinylornithine transaminase, ArgD [Helicobacter mustelae]|uniref:aspartate aminotransferase family protein n=1 Tax=Helicobacter mustelae TaxID=217 RepID=UPI000DFE7378|nr:aspartate aminotransferase family protein [Helicobacter mustelae]STP13180.1 succinylornithine transaminase, ArgD [Helicobacter mustelae]
MDLETLKKLDYNFVLHSYAKMEVNFVLGKNCTLYTQCGKDFIDFGSGIGVCSVGHSNPILNHCIKEQVDQLIHISNLYPNQPQVLLAEKIVELSKMPARVFFSNSGAEANETAIKIARKFGEEEGGIKRYKIITLKSSFHGRTLATLRATGQEKLHRYFSPFPDGFCIAEDILDIYNLIDSQTCAVMLELIQGEGGVNAFDKKQIQDLAIFLKEKKILLIVDEVQTGIYRSGEVFASHKYGILPDIITLAKGLGGGIPIGVTLTTLKDIFAPGDHGSTFGGNFLSSRAALCVLEILEKEFQSGAIALRIKHFDAYLRKIQEEFSDLFSGISGMGLMRGLKTKNVGLQNLVIRNAFEERLLVLKSGSDIVRFLPALTISDEEMRLGFERLRNACLKTMGQNSNSLAC